MRRPFDWLVICLSLLVLWANRVGLEPPSDRAAAMPQARVLPAPPLDQEPGPFAYIQEDGTQIFVPMTGSPTTRSPMRKSASPRIQPARQFERIHVGNDLAIPAVRAPASAVYTWSTTVVGTVIADSPATH